MTKYILRLDDACERMDVEKWTRIEALCEQYNIHPLVGVIPNNQDKHMSHYPFDNHFWTETLDRWHKKGWRIAMHGYEHTYSVRGKLAGGLNPVQDCSEYAGLSIDEQRRKIRLGLDVFKSHGHELPDVFFAPSHTYDENTVLVIRETGVIRFISDSIALRPYQKWGISFVPVQTGNPRSLPFFRLVTIACHPNTMSNEAISNLKLFISSHSFTDFPSTIVVNTESVFDKIIRKVYFSFRKIKYL